VLPGSETPSHQIHHRTIALRRAVPAHLRRIGVDPGVLRVSFVKVADYQRRAVIHYHNLIRLDPTDNDDTTTGASDVAGVMIAGHFAGPITCPRCSRNPAMRPEHRIWRTDEVCHDVATAGAMPDSLSQTVNDNSDWPAR
jgi:Replication initiator protein, pSAM2